MSSSITRSQALTILSAAASQPTAVPSLDNGGACSNHSIVVIGSAGISAGAVAFQWSHDNQNWVQPASGQPTVTASTVTAANFSGIPAQFIRAVITTPITGGTVTVSVSSAG